MIKFQSSLLSRLQTGGLSLPSTQLASFSSLNKPNRRQRKPASSRQNLMVKMAPHMALAGLFLLTSNAHLVAIPATTAAIHYLYLYNHLGKMTLYYDMQKLGTNENYVATFKQIRAVLMTDPRFTHYVDQTIQDEEVRDRTLIIENPVFQPFAYKEQGMVGRIDEHRQRFEFECVFRDLLKDSQGRIQSLVVFNQRNEAYFESLTIKMELPRQETIRVVEEKIGQGEAEYRNEPMRPTGEQHPKERPKSRYNQF